MFRKGILLHQCSLPWRNSFGNKISSGDSVTFCDLSLKIAFFLSPSFFLFDHFSVLFLLYSGPMCFPYFSQVIEYLGLRVQVYLAFVSAAKQFSKVVVLFLLPQAMQEHSPCSTSSPALSAVSSLIFSHLLVSHWGLTLHFPDD